MRECIRYRHYSLRTESANVHWALAVDGQEVARVRLEEALKNGH